MRNITKGIFLELILILLSFDNSILFATDKNPRMEFNFNMDWRVFTGDIPGAEAPEYNDSDWKKITLPYAWNEDDAFRLHIHDHSTGIAWYRKKFKIQENFKNSKVFIEFEGIRQAGEIYLNGEYIGLHENGVMAFGFDISDKLVFGNKENIIAIRIDNAWDYKEKATETEFQWNNSNFNANYGGIPKNVFLHITGKLHQTLPLYSNLGTTGQYVYAQDFNISNKSATITAESQIQNDDSKIRKFKYEVVIEDMDGKIIKTMDGGMHEIAPGESKIVKAGSVIENLHFWSWGYGYLYNVYTILRSDGEIIDEVKTRTGFRKTEFSNGIVKLNDRAILLKGYAQRTSNEWPASGLSVPPWVSDFSNRMMIESNANLVRWMHVTPWKQDVESCDRLGLLQAMPAGDAEKDREGRQWEQRVELMRDAIIYNRNNPSIIFYESGNRGISEAHMLEMKTIRDIYDPFGGRAAGSREMSDSKVAEYGGEMLYVNKSDDIPFWAMEYMRDEGLRKYWDEYSPPYHTDGDGPLYNEQDASAYNRNQDSHAIETIKRWFDYWRERIGTGKRVSSGGVNIIFSDSNTHCRGKENYRRSGEVDAVRIPKDAFFAHQVMWNGWVDTEKHSSHIIGHWNYTPEVIKDICVVSTGEKVELFVNGDSKGIGKQAYRFLFTFDSVQWQAGEIKAVSYDTENNVLCESVIITAGEPDHLKLTLHTSPAGLKADGADFALIDIEVVDAEGNRCPVANQLINFELEGPAEWRGGIAQGPDNYILSKQLPVECGINRVIIRSLREAGIIHLSATSDGLGSTSIEVKSVPVFSIDGLSLFMPQADLPSILAFGPTPTSVSFSNSRLSIDIVDAKAGANQEDVAFSFDGKQSTRWINDGDLATAWIKYKLKEVTSINQIALKLSGWRTRSYPIVVMAGDKEVFAGLTDRNLGYYYINFENVVTDNISIRLFGETEFEDVFNIVEITGKLDRETQDDKEVRNLNSLNIVEVEVFNKLESSLK